MVSINAGQGNKNVSFTSTSMNGSGIILQLIHTHSYSDSFRETAQSRRSSVCREIIFLCAGASVTVNDSSFPSEYANDFSCLF